MPLSFVNAVQTVVGFFLTFDHQVVILTWWAVFRDSFYYTLSVVALIAVRMSLAGGDIRFFLIVSFFFAHKFELTRIACPHLFQFIYDEKIVW